MNPTTFGAEYLETISAGSFGCGCADKLPAIKDATTGEVYEEGKTFPPL